jgi:hypothetical protein
VALTPDVRIFTRSDTRLPEQARPCLFLSRRIRKTL